MVFEEAIFILDKIGIIAFAFAGVSKGVQKKLDVFGLFIVGTLTAVAGGMVRDIILVKVPYAVSNIDYLAFAFVASLISIALYKFKFIVPAKPLLVADAVGLGVFAAAGAAVALGAGLSVLHVILLAIITAAGGGVLRDILVNEIPFVLRREIYATAAGVGGIAAYASFYLGYDVVTTMSVCAVVTVAIRFYAIWKKMHLPVIR